MTFEFRKRFLFLPLLAALFVVQNPPARAADDAKPIPIEAFVRGSQFVLPRLSPDGKHIAITVRTVDGDRIAPIMTVYRLTDMKVISAIRLPIFEVPLNYRWVNNTRLIVAKGKEFNSLEEPLATGEILATDLDGKNQDYVYGYNMFTSSSRGGTIGDDKAFGYIDGLPEVLNGHFYLGEHPWDIQATRSVLYDINAVNATRRRIGEIPVPYLSFLLTRAGEPAMAAGGGGNNRQVVYLRNTSKDEWQRLGADAVGYDFDPLAFTPDDREVYATYSADGGPDSLVRQSPTGKDRKVLASDQRGSIDMLMWGPPPSIPFAAGTFVGRPRLRYLDENDESAQLHKALSEQFPGSMVQFVNFTSDGQLLLFSVSSDRDPGSYYLFDRKKASAELLFSSRPQIDAARMAERRPVSFKARDGLDLYGYLTLPPGKEAKKLPMVLLPHGGPHGVADTWFYDNDAQFLASRGYAVLQVNYRGSGGRGMKYKQSGFRQWGGAIQNDLLDGVQWAVGQGIADGARVCSYGGSFGAYAAMMTAIRAPQMFKCAVGYSGRYDLAAMFTEDMTKRLKVRFNAFVDFVGQDPVELAQNSPVRLADKLTVPVLLVHGDEDEITPLPQAEAMRAALIKAGRPPEWLLAPHEGHGFYAIKNRTAFYQRLESFLAKHLGP